MAAGVVAAVLAALSFGMTTPLVAKYGAGHGAFGVAALLYVGAIGSALLPIGRRVSRGIPLGRRHFGRLLLVASLGAGIAPAALVWGIQHVGATTSSLLLNLEAGFTALFAWRIHREPMGRRVLAALVLMALGGALLAFDAAGGRSWTLIGALAVMVATMGWALDNVFSRPLADAHAMAVVAGKSALGSLMTGTIALALGESLPGGRDLLALLGCGVVGYGISLHLYLLAQRRIGATRTASVFAVAPFIGATLAWLMGDRGAGLLTVVACVLFAFGVWLHATEGHGHRHRHEATDHEHSHRHDDGHHDHVHVPPVQGTHSHPHHHESLEHSHPHAPDLHHRHEH